VQLTPEEAELVQASLERTDILDRAATELSKVGALSAAAGLHWENTKEKRHRRSLCKEHPAVAGALLAHGERLASDRREEHRRVRELKEGKLTLQGLKTNIDAAKEALKKRKAEVLALECLVECKHALKSFTFEFLGDGQQNNGGLKAKKARLEVMNRIANLGAGLTPTQRNDWAWFKEAWDKKMSGQHPDNWGSTFAGWMQKVVDDLRDNAGAISQFVATETRRCFADQQALRV
jgi:hypothetical protein